MRGSTRSGTGPPCWTGSSAWSRNADEDDPMTEPVVRTERLQLTPLPAPALDALLARDGATLERLTGARFADPAAPPYMADALPVVRDRLRQGAQVGAWWDLGPGAGEGAGG